MRVSTLFGVLIDAGVCANAGSARLEASNATNVNRPIGFMGGSPFVRERYPKRGRIVSSVTKAGLGALDSEAEFTTATHLTVRRWKSLILAVRSVPGGTDDETAHGHLATRQ